MENFQNCEKKFLFLLCRSKKMLYLCIRIPKDCTEPNNTY